MLLRSAAASPATVPLARQYATAALADFFHKKASRLGRSTLEELFSRSPELGAGLLPELLKECAVARTQFLQVRRRKLQRCFTVCGLLYRQRSAAGRWLVAGVAAGVRCRRACSSCRCGHWHCSASLSSGRCSADVDVPG